MSLGAVVWVVIGAGWALLLLVTTVVRPLPGVLRVLHGCVGSWAGRFVSLAAWGEAGWHIFCQRP
jgi:hypothetical protein